MDDELRLHYWYYYLSLEDDFLGTDRYVSINADNFTTFSLEYTRLLLAICSEIDVVCKLICNRIDPAKQPKKLPQYQPIVISKYPKIVEIAIQIERFRLCEIPWEGWSQNDTPTWWTAYNNVKHQRHKEFTSANLENTLKALCGLLVLNLYLYKERYDSFDLAPNSRLIPEAFPGPLTLHTGVGKLEL